MCYSSNENKYEIIAKIGEGGYGMIYKAREINTSNIVTIKQIKRQYPETNEGIPQSVLCEINILNELKNETNIINLKDVQYCKQRKNIYIIYDYYEFDLHHIIYQKQQITIQQMKSYMIQMIKSLQTVHSKGYIHCDIKPSNFLISPKNEIKLIDFGVSIKVDKENKNPKIGTINYNSPELILGYTKYGKEIDIWSLGCTFYEMMTKEKLIIYKHSEYEIINEILTIFGFPDKNDYPQFYSFPNNDLFPNFYKKSKININDFFYKKLPLEFLQFKDLLINMLQVNPKNRISLDDALNDPSLSDIQKTDNLPFISLPELNTFDNLKKNKKNHLNQKILI